VDSFILAFKTVVAVIIMSCGIMSVMQWLQIVPNVMPVEYGGAIRDVIAGGGNPDKGDSMIPEFKVVDKARATGFQTSVDTGIT